MYCQLQHYFDFSISTGLERVLNFVEWITENMFSHSYLKFYPNTNLINALPATAAILRSGDLPVGFNSWRCLLGNWQAARVSRHGQLFYCSSKEIVSSGHQFFGQSFDAGPGKWKSRLADLCRFCSSFDSPGTTALSRGRIWFGDFQYRLRPWFNHHRPLSECLLVGKVQTGESRR